MRRLYTSLLIALTFVLSVGAQTTTGTGKVDKPMELNKAQFLQKVMDFEGNPNEWKYLGKKPAIVDFYASWCGPCRSIAPVLEELAKEYSGEIYIYKVNTDKEREIAAAFGIRSLPSLLFIPMEGKPQMAQGALPKEVFVEAIDQILLNKKKP